MLNVSPNATHLLQLTIIVLSLTRTLVLKASVLISKNLPAICKVFAVIPAPRCAHVAFVSVCSLLGQKLSIIRLQQRIGAQPCSSSVTARLICLLIGRKKVIFTSSTGLRSISMDILQHIRVRLGYLTSVRTVT